MSVLIYYCALLGYLALPALTQAVGSNVTEIKKCFVNDPEISKNTSALTSCFKDVIGVQDTGSNITRKCVIFEDFSESYHNFLKHGVEKCVNETIQEKFSSQERKFLDFFGLLMKNETLSEFIADDGISCIKRNSLSITGCIEKDSKVLPAVDASWEWTRRTQLLFDEASCSITSKIKDCVVPLLKKNCTQPSTDYVKGLFDFVLHNEHLCNDTSYARRTLPTVQEPTSSFPVWAICLIVFAALILIGLIIFFVTKKSANYDIRLHFHKEKE